MNHSELRIRDERRYGHRLLVEFSALLKALSEPVGDRLNGDWIIFKGAYGYGEKVCAIEDSLESQESLVIGGNILLPVLLADLEYFDNVRIKLADWNMEFGVHDSTFHYVRGERGLLEEIAERFDATEMIDIVD